MNRARLKTYAPKARLDFMRAVTDRARKIGLTAGHSEPVKVSGDVAIILGQQLPRVVAEQRRRLDERIERQGFGAVMEEVAYTWFNRFMAIRYMELHGYLDHGFRVLSHPEGKERPEILDHAEHVDNLPGLDRAKVVDLKLDGTQDETLYKMLLLAQCHALHAAMPFLFEKIDDQTELLLPDNLLASDSIIRKMVTEIAEEDWEEIEVIGWLYQFYISDKKDEVIGKVVKSEDIPAATQLFTPNWIVKYMVQNSLGRKWLATYPHSPLKAKMEYYIEPAEQTPEVQAQLDAITPTELNPEELTLIDPACGSGHILCEAYDLFKEIYLERGYRLREIPRLILEKNLYGLDIDDRATQMAGFTLLMKARQDDRLILERSPDLNVLALQSSAGMDADEIAANLLAEETFELILSGELFPETRQQPSLTAQIGRAVGTIDIRGLINLFVQAKTFGSLITVPSALESRLPYLSELIHVNTATSDLLKQRLVNELETLVKQAVLLSRQYDVAVMNPPYMGSSGINSYLKAFLLREFSNSRSDLSASFISRAYSLVKDGSWAALVTMQSWMFLTSLEQLRGFLLRNVWVTTVAHHGIGAFRELNSKVVQTVAFAVQKLPLVEAISTFQDIRDGSEETKRQNLYARTFKQYDLAQTEIMCIPGGIFAYWLTPQVRSCFRSFPRLSEFASLRQGLATGENARFLRYWWEVNFSEIGLRIEDREHAQNSGLKWFPYNKGGQYRKWFGNHEFVINWASDGTEIRNFVDGDGRLRSRPQNLDFFFKESVSWSKVTSSSFAVRYYPAGFVFDVAGCSLFPHDKTQMLGLLALLNSRLTRILLSDMSATLNFEVGQVSAMPVAPVNSPSLGALADQCLQIAISDWAMSEQSWDFQKSQLLCFSNDSILIRDCASFLKMELMERIDLASEKETEINRILIEAYGLGDEVSPTVDATEITLSHYTEHEPLQALVLYAIGCMMGRYSLDNPGLIYAHARSQGFDPSQYTVFSADDDGILPLTDIDWFGKDDIANRISEFLSVAWPVQSLSENLKFVADSLEPKADEAPIDTIRRYLCAGFFKDHLQTYKRRPIYWLFSSGKERAFQALVYIHRYNEGTLARMRMDYVVPLQSRMSARIDQLREDIAASVTTADRKKREKEREKLLRQLEELRIFDEKLRHYADMRISLDLDDGVKVNYGKFGDLLAEVKAVTGGSDE